MRSASTTIGSLKCCDCECMDIWVGMYPGLLPLAVFFMAFFLGLLAFGVSPDVASAIAFGAAVCASCVCGGLMMYLANRRKEKEVELTLRRRRRDGDLKQNQTHKVSL